MPEHFRVMFEHYLHLTVLTRCAIVHGLDVWESIEDRRQALEGRLRRRYPATWAAHAQAAEATDAAVEHTVGPDAAQRCSLCAEGLHMIDLTVVDSETARQ